MREKAFESLRKVPFFQGLADEALEVVYSESQRATYSADEFIFFQDDPADRIFVLVEGRVKLIQIAPDGQQVIMRVATPWMMFGGFGMIEGVVYPISAQAAEESRVLVWSQESILRLFGRYPILALNALRVLATHVREFQDRFRELATERVERRLARTIIRLASQTGRKTDEGVLLDLPLSRQDLAELCGTTLYTVSRIFTQWESQGLIHAGREKVIIRFPHGLVSIAEDLARPLESQGN